MTSRHLTIKPYSLIAGGFVFIVVGSHLIKHTVSAVLTALVLAYLLNPLLSYLEKKGARRLPALAVIYTMASLAIVGILLLLFPFLGEQFRAMATGVPAYIQKVKSGLDFWKADLAPYYSGEEGVWLIGRLQEALDKVAVEASSVGLERVKGIMYGLFDLILAPILVFFMLLYKEQVKGALLRVISSENGCGAIELGQRINRTLEKFLISLLIDSLLVGLLTTGALYFLGIDFPLLNGLFAGFASIVPFIGPTVAVIPPAVIGYAKTSNASIIPVIIATYFVINVIIEGNLIKPLVMRGTLNLNPLLVIFAIMAMGELMGFWGVILAVPIAAVVKICAGEYKKQRAGAKTARSAG